MDEANWSAVSRTGSASATARGENFPGRGISKGGATLALGVLLVVSPLVASVSACGGADDAEDPVPRPLSEERLVAESDGYIHGRFHRFEGSAVPSALEMEQMQRLQAIGYVAGSEPAATNEVVTVYDPEATWAGLNLLTSGHAPAAYLIDMNGNILHRWERAFDEIFPAAQLDSNQANVTFWRRARVYPDGDLVVVFTGGGIVRLDRDSRVLWARLNQAHHDIHIGRDGRITTLTRSRRLVPRIHPEVPILEDFVVVLDAAGEELQRVSVLKAFERSTFLELVLSAAGEGGDFLHTNTVTVLEQPRYPVDWLRPGHVLVSVRNPSVLGVIDMERGTVVKAWKGVFRRQHEPEYVEPGRILLFDNLGPGSNSRALEIDVHSLEPVWEYHGPPEQPLRSWTSGTTKRLPNGNTLITSSDEGRCVEVAADGRIVWEFYSPFRVGEDPVYIATLFEVERLPLDFGAEWIRAR